MGNNRFVRVVALVGAALVTTGAVVAYAPAPATAAASADEVSPAEDNPPGCTTATAESQEQCGAQGRDHFASAGRKNPIDACKNVASPAGSLLTRVLPNGPRRADNSLAFVPGVCVYLPPGYASGALRYPTLYLLHGGGGDQADWVNFGGIQKMLDDSYAADPSHAVIALLPDGRSGMYFDYYSKQFLFETYILRHVLPYVDAHFRTIADKRGRAIVGLSNGGYGAMHLAAKAPDLFVAAGTMSGNIGGRGFSDLGTPIAPGGPSSQEAGATYYGSAPVSMASNLDPVDLVTDLGTSCSSDVTIDLCATLAVDLGFKADNEAFRDQLAADGYTGTLDFRESEGSHAWRWWTKWLRERQLPFVLARLADPQPVKAPVKASPLPAKFRYRSIAPAFSIFGYDVSVARPQREFLDLTHVTADGLSVTGTGLATVTTAARYHPGATYGITGTDGALDTARADGTGRLRFVVDLGPGHTEEQYSPQARLEEAAGQFGFVTRGIAIKLLNEKPALVASRAVVSSTPATGASPAPAALAGGLLLAALILRRSRLVR